MDIRAFIKRHFNGNMSDLAREFRVTPQAVQYWVRVGLSPQREAQLELWALKKRKP